MYSEQIYKRTENLSHCHVLQNFYLCTFNFSKNVLCVYFFNYVDPEETMLKFITHYEQKIVFMYARGFKTFLKLTGLALFKYQNAAVRSLK
jgi:hypothetical protein